MQAGVTVNRGLYRAGEKGVRKGSWMTCLELNPKDLGRKGGKLPAFEGAALRIVAVGMGLEARNRVWRREEVGGWNIWGGVKAQVLGEGRCADYALKIFFSFSGSFLLG